MTTHLFILVHGTFAANAAWVKESSDLCRALTQTFPNAQLRTFRWSGRNTHSARLTAADDLGRMILSATSEYPEAKVHVIAHSHGGNIAFYACRNSAVAKCVTSIACISTPFIICGLCDIDWLVHRIFSFTAGAIIMGLMFAYLAVIAARGESISIWVACFLTWIAYIIVEQLRLRAVPLCTKMFIARQKKIFDRISLPSLDVPVLAIKASGDEAAGWLRLSYLVTALAALMHRLLYILAILAVLAMLPVYQFVVKPNGGDALLVYSALFYIFAGGLIAYILIMAVGLLFRAHPLAFGWEGIGDSLLIALTVWKAPSFMQCNYLDIELQPLRLGLRHSALYSHKKVLGSIPAWIRHADEALARPRRDLLMSDPTST